MPALVADGYINNTKLVDSIGIEPMPAKDYVPRRASQLTPGAHCLVPAVRLELTQER